MEDAAYRRLSLISNHLCAKQTNAINTNNTSAQTSDNDVVVVYAKRTAIAKGKKGSFRDTTQDQLLIPLFKDAVSSLKLNAQDVGDIVIGNVLPKSSQGAAEVRIASLLAKLPKEVPCTTVDRQCSSGLQAVANVAASIKAGFYDLGIAGGVELMSLYPMGTWDGKVNEQLFEDELAKGCLMAMGVTSDNVAQKYNISRKKQDEASVISHKRAYEAQKSGKFKEEIVPVTITLEDKKVTVTEDEGIRADTSLEGLGKLKPVFTPTGTTTAGNSSQVSDGAAVVVLAKRCYAKKHNLPILGSVVSFAAVGVEPDVMGVGPAFAIPEALKKANLTLKDIDLFEINEAFASQYVWSVEKLGIPFDKVNVNGGAIALGHPLGATGARQTASLFHELKRRKGKYGVVSMCCGTGMGAAMVYKNEAN